MVTEVTEVTVATVMTVMTDMPGTPNACFGRLWQLAQAQPEILLFVHDKEGISINMNDLALENRDHRGIRPQH